MRTRHQEERQGSVEASKRTSRKRRASSASAVDLSDTPTTTPHLTTNKRRKRQSGASEVIDEEVEQVEETVTVETVQETITVEQHHSHPASASALASPPLAGDDEVEYDSITVIPDPNPSSSRHVHFSNTQNGNGSTSTHLTPHVNKNKRSLHRRITLSPATFAGSPISRSTGARASLPPNFSLSQEDVAGNNVELQFTPLSQILQDRVRRRLRRNHLSEETNAIHEHHKIEAKARQELKQLRNDIRERDDKVQQLLYELEMQNQLGIDVPDDNTAERQKIKDMEQELAALRQEIELKREQEAAMPQLDSSPDTTDLFDDDMMIINSSMEAADDDNDDDDHAISYPDLSSMSPSQDMQQTPLRSYARATDQVIVNDAQTQISLPDSSTQAEREAFEEAVKFWTREAADAKATIQILTIELQSLGFGDSTTNTEVVLNSIRESFLHVRERLETCLPGQSRADLSNRELLDVVADHLESLATRVASQDAALKDATNLREELLSEIDGLVDRLSDAEIRKTELERSFREADRQTQDDERFIAQLEQKLEEITKDHAIVQSMLDAKNSELQTLETTNTELDVTVDKLGVALDGYRVSEEKLQALVERMEREHLHALADLEKVRKDAIDDLEARLEEESSERETFEQEAADKQASITSLELSVAQSEAELLSLKQRLALTEEEKAAERVAKESAEYEVEEKSAFVEDLEVKIEKAENDLEELREELDRLREMNEAEKRQRLAAEEELDVRENTIEKLDEQLQQQGIEANKLRQKLFEMQLKLKESVQKLEEEAQTREERFREDMSEEIARRDHAEATAASRNVTIAQMQEKLQQTEDAMTETLQDRDEKITELGALADRLEAELEKTNVELDNTITELENLQSSSDTRIVQLSEDIATLQDQVAEQAALISSLESEAVTTAELHSTAITDRDTAIANLNHEIFEAKNLVADLESEKISLERRVEAEAESMLELQASKDDEIAALKHTITVKQGDVENLKHRAEDVDKAWEKLLNERDEEIEELKTTGDESSKLVLRLTKLNANLKEKLRRFVRDSTATANAMREDFESALDASIQKSNDLRDEGDRVLEEVEAMDQVGELQEVQLSITNGGSAPKNKLLQKFKKASKNKRQYDSGIGIEEGDESMIAE